ncbi:MAG: ROK family transcriptional regulator [Candidatus Devosia phytovorans]|uniref:ROK family transcriptional regulator n=1 Tax=Candidatus Devosia phytovorans TaxID=3121372 RepID=A0AAJ6AZI7_9HYPH|nr:ROK family transcriptional regulator [Devosia sp.]WEK03846.1 MAG: ROK family transcriptional regulator [Devosia sp.]
MTVKPELVRDVFDAGGRGLQHHGLRRANERAVLTLIGFNSGVSNAEIARLSGLAPQTVSAILIDLEQDGLITRGPVLRGRRGQPATPIFLRSEGAYSIGVELGWRHVDVVMIDLTANVLGTRRWHYDFPDARTLPGEIAKAIGELRAGLSDAGQSRLRDIGVSMPADMAGYMHLSEAPEEQGALWANLDLAGDLERRCGLDVSLVNDGNAACWAELIALSRPRSGDFIYFMIGRCIAAGIVGEGSLWEGSSGNSANMGAMLVRQGDGPLQPAYRIASTAVLEKRLEDAGFLMISGQFETWDWDTFAPVVDQWIKDSGNALARVVYNTTMVIETALVVLDTILPPALGERLVAEVESELKHLPVPASYRPPQVMLGHLGAMAPSMGAGELTLYRRFFSRTLADLVG